MASGVEGTAEHKTDQILQGFATGVVESEILEVLLLELEQVESSSNAAGVRRKAGEVAQLELIIFCVEFEDGLTQLINLYWHPFFIQ